MIEVNNLTKRYRNLKVLDDVSLKIRPKEITAFIGANGAGKTTLLKAISRLITFDSGHILVEGQKLGDWSSRDFAKKVSLLKQSNSINARLTIRELVSFGRFPHSRGWLNTEDWDSVDRALAYLNLTEISNQYLDELSGGQRQRAFIAMVVAQDTDYVLLDEPLNNLDLKHSAEMMNILRSLVDELGKTVVLVLHDVNVAACYADRLIALKHGKVIHQGVVGQVINEQVLSEVFEIPFKIVEIDNQKVCLSFQRRTVPHEIDP